MEWPLKIPHAMRRTLREKRARLRMLLVGSGTWSKTSRNERKATIEKQIQFLHGHSATYLSEHEKKQERKGEEEKRNQCR